jgi:hypothetical protein
MLWIAVMSKTVNPLVAGSSPAPGVLLPLRNEGLFIPFLKICLKCESMNLRISFSLTPEVPPLIQQFQISPDRL